MFSILNFKNEQKLVPNKYLDRGELGGGGGVVVLVVMKLGLRITRYFTRWKKKKFNNFKYNICNHFVVFF